MTACHGLDDRRALSNDGLARYAGSRAYRTEIGLVSICLIFKDTAICHAFSVPGQPMDSGKWPPGYLSRGGIGWCCMPAILSAHAKQCKPYRAGRPRYGFARSVDRGVWALVGDPAAGV